MLPSAAEMPPCAATVWDRVSVAGYGRETTPELEAFAKDAAVFTDAWSPAA